MVLIVLTMLIIIFLSSVIAEGGLSKALMLIKELKLKYFYTNILKSKSQTDKVSKIRAAISWIYLIGSYLVLVTTKNNKDLFNILIISLVIIFIGIVLIFFSIRLKK